MILEVYLATPKHFKESIIRRIEMLPFLKKSKYNWIAQNICWGSSLTLQENGRVRKNKRSLEFFNYYLPHAWNLVLPILVFWMSSHIGKRPDFYSGDDRHSRMDERFRLKTCRFKAKLYSLSCLLTLEDFLSFSL